jgi:hypothetical protein
MIVQVTNTGYDLNQNQFDISIPGGGWGLYNGCPAQYSGNYNYGQQYGGVSSASACSGLPSILQAGCNWRFSWFDNNPTMTFYRVKCPAAITAKSNCIRNDDNSYPSS